MKFNNKYKNRMTEYSHEKIKNDEYYTSREEVEYIFEKVIPQGFLKDKIIYCPCDSEESKFVKYLKENKDRYEYKEFIYTWDDFNTHVDLFEYADFVITNPPFSKIKKELLPILEKHSKYWFIFHSVASIPVYDDIDVHIYRSPQQFKFNTPHELCKGGYETTIQHIYISNFECNMPNTVKKKPEKTFNELYRYKEPVYGFNINDADRYLCIDKIADIPIDYKEPMLVPITIMIENNRTEYEVLITKYSKKNITQYTDNKPRFHRYLVRRKQYIETYCKK